MKQPQASEHHEYYGRYIKKVPDGNIIRVLDDQAEETLSLLAGIPPEQTAHRYAPEKWSIKVLFALLLLPAKPLGHSLPGWQSWRFFRSSCCCCLSFWRASRAASWCCLFSYRSF